MTLIFQSTFPPIIPNGSRLWPPEAFSLTWLDRQASCKGRGVSVEPATVAKVEGSGGPWSGITPLKTALVPQPPAEARIGLIKKDSTK